MKDNQKRSWANWFEIPVSNFERAKKFYETIYQIDIETIEMGPSKMGIFPHNEVGCSIICNDGYEPGHTGPIIYLNANPDLDDVLNRIEESGGKIIQAKKTISEEYGAMALFLDSEGNRLALHSMK